MGVGAAWRGRSHCALWDVTQSPQAVCLSGRTNPGRGPGGAKATFAAGESSEGRLRSYLSFPPGDKRFLKLMSPGGRPSHPFVLNSLSD